MTVTYEPPTFIKALQDEWHNVLCLEDLEGFQYGDKPKTIRNASFGSRQVSEKRIAEGHRYFQKSDTKPEAVAHFLVTQLAHHAGIPHAPVLISTDGKSSSSLRLAYNVASGSFFEVLLDQLESGKTENLPQEIIDRFNVMKEVKAKYRDKSPLQFQYFTTMGSDVIPKGWDRDFIHPYLSENIPFISRLYAFKQMVCDLEGLYNLGNLIVNKRNPSQILYAIDTDADILNNSSVGSFSFSFMDGNVGHSLFKHPYPREFIDETIFNQAKEEFQDKLSDRVIDEAVDKSIAVNFRTMAKGERYGHYRSDEDFAYYSKLRRFLKWNRDTCTLQVS